MPYTGLWNWRMFKQCIESGNLIDLLTNVSTQTQMGRLPRTRLDIQALARRLIKGAGKRKRQHPGNVEIFRNGSGQQISRVYQTLFRRLSLDLSHSVLSDATFNYNALSVRKQVELQTLLLCILKKKETQTLHPLYPNKKKICKK